MAKRVSNKKFILFDGRAKSGNDEDAEVLCCADTEKAALKDTEDCFDGYDAIWWEYEFDPVKNQATNGKPRWDMPPAI